MTKIGIMSMQRVYNYGSYLQAYGLMKTIEEIGNDVEFVDYEYERCVVEKNSKRSLIKKVLYNLNIFKFIDKKIVHHKFRKMFNEYLLKLGVDKKNIRPNIDNLVIGSDEVFNCLQPYPVGYSRELFGKNYESKKVISYAASFGFTNYKKLKEYKIDNEIGQLLNNFYAISVRDQNSYNTVKQLTDNKVEINLDPVLITDFSKEISKYTIQIKDYIVVYAYEHRLTKEEEKYIKKFAKKIKKKIISIGFYQRVADKNIVCNPFEMLAYIKNADYVITDTFHGSIFSMKTNTKFCTIIRESNKNKLEDLLERLEQGNRKVQELEEIEILYNKEIDFEQTNKIIENERKRTMEYLKNNLK